jgi:hypothetical protein
VTPRLLRWIVGIVFVGGIAGMIVGSILDNNGVAITAGLVTAVAAICLMLMTALLNNPRDVMRFDDETALDIESQIAHIVAAGADESDVRSLVRHAVRLGRSAR